MAHSRWTSRRHSVGVFRACRCEHSVSSTPIDRCLRDRAGFKLAADGQRLAEQVLGGMEVDEGQEPRDGMTGPEVVHPTCLIVVELRRSVRRWPGGRRRRARRDPRRRGWRLLMGWPRQVRIDTRCRADRSMRSLSSRTWVGVIAGGRPFSVRCARGTASLSWFVGKLLLEGCVWVAGRRRWAG